MGPILPCYLPYGKAGGLQTLRFQGFAVVHYSFTLSALALKPSDFCNAGVYPPLNESRLTFIRKLY